MDGSVLWRAALLQALTLAVVALVLGALLDREFFRSWGWLAGPGAWAACALFTGTVLRLPPLWVLAGAALAGLPSLVSVLIGVHWLGAPFAVALFAPGADGSRANAKGGRLMDLGLQGKVALVTGGSKGIGRGIAEGLVAEGARVALTSRSGERAEAVAAEIGARGYAFDSDDLDAIAALLDAGRGRPRPDRHLHRQHRRPARRATRSRSRASSGRRRSGRC